LEEGLMGIKIVNRYTPGDVYTFEMEDGRWGAGMPWLHDPRKRYGANFCLMAGFRIRKPVPVTMSDLEGISIRDICTTGVYKERRLVDGTWTRIGPLPGFSIETWPLPVFHENMLTGAVLEVDLSNRSGFGKVLVPRGALSEQELRLVIRTFVIGFEDGLPGTIHDVLKNQRHWRACRITDECVAFWAKLREACARREAAASAKRRRARAKAAAQGSRREAR
jgi:hypothetical protein